MAPTTASAQTYQKHFIPLESNPDVFTELIHKLGVSETLCFQDVLSLDDPDLLAFIPRPVYALLLVFPTTEAYDKKVEAEDQVHEEHGANDDERNVLFFKQTINNACGLYAILHAVCNGVARDMLGIHGPSSLDTLMLMKRRPELHHRQTAAQRIFTDSGRLCPCSRE
jgi:ubiquitin carboxyl-terminal hydrolase L3